METYTRFLLRHRFTVLAVVFATLLVSVWLARDVRIRFQYRDFYTYDGNPQLPIFDAYHRDFGDPGGHVVVYLRTSDVFRRDVLGFIQDLTRRLEREPAFVRVQSLATANVPRGSSDGVATGAIMPAVPEGDEQLQALRQLALSSPLLVHRLVSESGTATAILAEMATPAETATVEEQRQALAVVERALAQTPVPPNVTVEITGAPRVETATTHALLTDQFVLVPGVLAVVIAVLFAIFRSLHGVLLPMLSVSLALGWTAGIFGLLGRNVDIVGSIIPTTLLVYGVVDPIFVMTRYLLRRKQGLERHDAIVATMKELAAPCLLTSVTTALGFAAFAFATLPTVASYGTTVAIGVVLVWVSTVNVLPILLSLFPEPPLNDAALRATQSVTAYFTKLWVRLSKAPAKIILLASLGLLATSFYARDQRISNEYVGSLPRGQTHDVVRAMEQDLGGVVRTVVYLEGEPGSMKRIEVLRAMARVEAFLDAQPDVTSATSLADIVAESSQAFNEGDPKYRHVPDSAFLAAQYLTLVAPIDRADLVTDDYSRAIVVALTRDRGSERMRTMRTELRREVDQAFAGLGVQATLTGNSVVAWTALDSIVREVIIGFGVAFALVLLLVLIVFRSVRLALSIVLPNLIPAAVCFGVIRLLGLSLRLDNSIVLCIAIGGLFNTTIHLAAQLRMGIREGLSPNDALAAAVGEVASPSLVTTIILAAGFAVLLGSSFRGMQELGILTIFTVVSAFIADMVVTPAVIQKWVLPARSRSPVTEPAFPIPLTPRQ